jgi:CHASE3 domain sensor protein
MSGKSRWKSMPLLRKGASRRFWLASCSLRRADGLTTPALWFSLITGHASADCPTHIALTVKILPNKTVCVTLAVGFGLFVAVAFFNWRSSNQLHLTSTAVSQSHQVRANLTRLLAAVQDTQMGLRGYLLTGDSYFLQPYTFGVQQVQFQFDRLVRLTSDNSAQQSRLHTLKPLLDQSLGQAHDTIALRETAGFEPARRAIASRKDQLLTDAIRLAIQEMDQAEAALLVTRAQAAREASDLNLSAVAASAGVCFIFFVAAAILFMRTGRNRASENELAAQKLTSQIVPVFQDQTPRKPADKPAPVVEKAKPVETPVAQTREPLAKKQPEPMRKQEILPQTKPQTPATPHPAPQPTSRPTPQVAAAQTAPPATRPVQKTVTPTPAGTTTFTKKQETAPESRPAPEARPAPAPVAEAKPKPAARPSTPFPTDTSPILFGKKSDAPAEPRKPDFRPQPLGPIIEQVVAMLIPAAETQQITLGQQLAPDLPELPLDADSVSEVLVNLLTNALKFTPFGGNILVTAGQPFPGVVHVSVIDSGCGIPADRSERIFECQDQSKANSLHMSRQLVRQHGGQIWVQSEPGKGSTFTFSLPLRRVAATPKPEAKPVPALDTEIGEFTWQRTDKAA